MFTPVIPRVLIHAGCDLIVRDRVAVLVEVVGGPGFAVDSVRFAMKADDLGVQVAPALELRRRDVTVPHPPVVAELGDPTSRSMRSTLLSTCSACINENLSALRNSPRSTRLLFKKSRSFLQLPNFAAKSLQSHALGDRQGIVAQC